MKWSACFTTSFPNDGNPIPMAITWRCHQGGGLWLGAHRNVVAAVVVYIKQHSSFRLVPSNVRAVQTDADAFGGYKSTTPGTPFKYEKRKYFRCANFYPFQKKPRKQLNGNKAKIRDTNDRPRSNRDERTKDNEIKKRGAKKSLETRGKIDRSPSMIRYNGTTTKQATTNVTPNK